MTSIALKRKHGFAATRCKRLPGIFAGWRSAGPRGSVKIRLRVAPSLLVSSRLHARLILWPDRATRRRRSSAMAKDGMREVSRREALLVAAGGLAAALAPRGPAQAAEGATVSGVVFEDLDGSGRRDAKSPGVAGVLVSNGRDVAVTDADGRYSAAVARRGDDLRRQAGRLHAAGRSRPRGCRASIAIHRPLGSPASLELTFAGLAPTEPLPASLDFPLRPPGRAGRLRGRACSPTRSPNRTRRWISSART